MHALRPAQTEARCDFPQHASGDLGLRREDVVAFQLVFARPKLRAVGNMNEIDDYAASVARHQYTSLDHMAQTHLRCCSTKRPLLQIAVRDGFQSVQVREFGCQ